MGKQKQGKSNLPTRPAGGMAIASGWPVHEVLLSRDLVRRGDLEPAYKSLARVSRIQTVMTLSWDVLATMTPADYLSFREVLGTSSGFQSHQFRRLEYLLGLKDAAFLRFHTERPQALAELTSALESPSLYDEALAQLSKHGIGLPDKVLKRDFAQTYAPSQAVEEAWLQVYREPRRYWELYQLARMKFREGKVEAQENLESE